MLPDYSHVSPRLCAPPEIRQRAESHRLNVSPQPPALGFECPKQDIVACGKLEIELSLVAGLRWRGKALSTGALRVGIWRVHPEKTPCFLQISLMKRERLCHDDRQSCPACLRHEDADESSIVKILRTIP